MLTPTERKRNLITLRNFITANVVQKTYESKMFGDKDDTHGCLMFHAYYNDPTQGVLPTEINNLFYDHEQTAGYAAHAFDTPELRDALGKHYFVGAHDWFQNPPKRLRDALKRLQSEIDKCDKLISQTPTVTSQTPTVTSDSTTVAINGITFNASIKDGKVSINAEGLTLKQFMAFVKG